MGILLISRWAATKVSGQGYSAFNWSVLVCPIGRSNNISGRLFLDFKDKVQEWSCLVGGSFPGYARNCWLEVYSWEAASRARPEIAQAHLIQVPERKLLSLVEGLRICSSSSFRGPPFDYPFCPVAIPIVSRHLFQIH